MSLPKRKDAGKIGWIPDDAARKAAEQYGAPQGAPVGGEK